MSRRKINDQFQYQYLIQNIEQVKCANHIDNKLYPSVNDVVFTIKKPSDLKPQSTGVFTVCFYTNTFTQLKFLNEGRILYICEDIYDFHYFQSVLNVKFVERLFINGQSNKYDKIIFINPTTTPETFKKSYTIIFTTLPSPLFNVLNGMCSRIYDLYVERGDCEQSPLPILHNALLPSLIYGPNRQITQTSWYLKIILGRLCLGILKISNNLFRLLRDDLMKLSLYTHFQIHGKDQWVCNTLSSEKSGTGQPIYSLE